MCGGSAPGARRPAWEDADALTGTHGRPGHPISRRGRGELLDRPFRAVASTAKGIRLLSIQPSRVGGHESFRPAAA